MPIQSSFISYKSNFTFSSSQSTCQEACLSDLASFQDSLDPKQMEDFRNHLTRYSNLQDFSTLSKEDAVLLDKILTFFAGSFSMSQFEKTLQYCEERIKLAKLTLVNEALIYLNLFFLSFYSEQAEHKKDSGKWLEKALSAHSKKLFQDMNNKSLESSNVGIKIGRALLLQEEGKLKEALELYEEINKDAQKVLESDFKDYLPLVQKEMASIHFNQGNKAKGIEFIKKAIEVDSSAGPEQYHQSAYKCQNMAMFLHERKEYKEAFSLAKRANEIFAEFLPPHTIDVIHNNILLGHLAYELKDYEAAAQHYETAMESLENFHPEKVAQLEEIYEEISKAYFLANEDQKAVEAFEKLLNLQKDIQNPRLINLLYSFAFQLNDRDSTRKEALKYVELALDLHSKQAERNPIQELNLLYLYGAILQREGQLRKAMEVLEGIETPIKEIHNLPSAIAAGIYLFRGDIAFELEDWEKSIEMYEQTAFLPGLEDITFMTSAFEKMSQAYEKMNLLEDAEEALNALLELHVEVFGEHDTRTKNSLQSLLGFLERCQWEEKAKELRVKFEPSPAAT